MKPFWGAAALAGAILIFGLWQKDKQIEALEARVQAETLARLNAEAEADSTRRIAAGWERLARQPSEMPVEGPSSLSETLRAQTGVRVRPRIEEAPGAVQRPPRASEPVDTIRASIEAQIAAIEVKIVGEEAFWTIRPNPILIQVSVGCRDGAAVVGVEVEPEPEFVDIEEPRVAAEVCNPATISKDGRGFFAGVASGVLGTVLLRALVVF